LVWKPEGRRPFGRPSLRWENSIKMDVQEIELEGMNWMWLGIGTSIGLF